MRQSNDTIKPEIQIPADLLVRCPDLQELRASQEERGVTLGDLYKKSTDELLAQYIRCAAKDDKLIEAAERLQEAYNQQ